MVDSSSGAVNLKKSAEYTVYDPNIVYEKTWQWVSKYDSVK